MLKFFISLFLVHLAFAFNGCTESDLNVMKEAGGGDGDGSFPKIVADCAKKAYSVFGGFNKNKMVSCVGGKIPITEPCANCFAGSAEYGVDNCKLKCISSWCSQGCLDCAKPYQPTLDQCTGLTEDQVPQPTPCNSKEEEQGVFAKLITAIKRVFD